MSFLSRHEIGRAIAMTASEAAKARRVVDDMDKVMVMVRGHVTTSEDHAYLECLRDIDVNVNDHGVSGVSVDIIDRRDVRTRKLALHIHGRPAHFPDKGGDPVSTANLAVSLARQCIRVAASKRSLPPKDVDAHTSKEAERHAMRLAAGAVASGHQPTGEINDQTHVMHPWGDAPALASVVLNGRRTDAVAIVPMAGLMELAVVGNAGDRDLHVRGHMRSACIRSVASDTVEMMRLIGELHDIEEAARHDAGHEDSRSIS